MEKLLESFSVGLFFWQLILFLVLLFLLRKYAWKPILTSVINREESIKEGLESAEKAKEQYRSGTIGDVDCKKQLIDVLVDLLAPMQARRKPYEQDQQQVMQLLREGTERANAIAEQTLLLAKRAMSQAYFDRSIHLTDIIDD